MKRMTENPINYYTVTANDIKNITAKSSSTFTYTPSEEFIEVLKDFKAVLRVDWTEVAESISNIIGSKLSVLYPVNKITITDEGDVAYAYSAGTANNKAVNPAFYEIDGKYYIEWLSLAN